MLYSPCTHPHEMTDSARKRRIKTLGEAYKYTQEHKWKGKASARPNAFNIERYWEFTGKSLPLTRMQEAWWWDEFKAHIRETRPTITDSTINRIITTGTTCFAFTRGRGLHTCDLPKADIREKEGKHRVTWFTREQVDEMYRMGHKLATDENGYGVVANAILFAAYTGVRREELCKLRTKDINLEDGKVWIGGKPEVVTKTGDYRAVKIAKRILPLCTQLVATNSPDVRVFGQHFEHHKIVGEAFLTRFEVIRNRVGIDKDYKFHTLRHSFATWLGETASPRDVMKAGGWKRFETVLRYCHASDDSLDKAMADW